MRDHDLAREVAVAVQGREVEVVIRNDTDQADVYLFYLGLNFFHYK